MPKPFYILITAFLSFSTNTFAQVIEGTVTDTTGKPMAFATIKLGDTKQGKMADLKGNFRLIANSSFDYITVSHLGYKPRRIYINEFVTSQPMIIILEFADADLEEVVIKNSTSKIKRILSSAINNRNRNNPEKYDWYQCNVYYKTVVNFTADSTAIDTTDAVEVKDAKDTKEVVEEFNYDKHFFMTENFSRRTWERPQKLQEEVYGTRISGFKRAWFSSFVTDVLPFHAYNDFLTFNGKDYHNPLSNGLHQRFNFRLEDEILQGTDTVWQISFTPKRNAEHLSGSLFISSRFFAITNLKAQHYDSSLKRMVGIEQQYTLKDDKWFPEQLNYFIKWQNFMHQPIELAMTGTSLIDSISFVKDKKFRFDKAHTAKLKPGADELTDAEWEKLRPTPLDAKEDRTYQFMDSIGNKNGFDKMPRLFEKLSEGYFPWKKVDIDLQRIYSFNKYEGHRLGFGLRTSDKISRRFSIGGWFGYGTKDKNLKYGAWAELYADRYKEFTVKASYKKDLQDPGRLQVHQELDRNFLRRFLLGRVDKIETYSLEVNKRLGYWNTGLSIVSEKIIPQYNYTLTHSGKSWQSFESKEVVLNIRYAYAERMSPIMGKYYSTGSKFPIFYSKIKVGQINTDNNYIHAIAGVKWQKHINRFGNEQFLLLAGGVFSNKALPLSKLFAGNGFLIDQNSIYVFGGMQTMLPYEYYSDRFINFYWKHDFDFKLYNQKITKGLSSSPFLGLGYNVLVGKLKNADAHKGVSFSIPDQAYHEVGMMLNRIVRMKVMSMYHVNLNAGYYYHLKGSFNHKQNGRFVFGIGVDL